MQRHAIGFIATGAFFLGLAFFMPAQAAQPIVEFLFSEGAGTTAANSGSAGGTVGTAALTGTVPIWSTQIPANAGPGALDFGTTQGEYAVDLPQVQSLKNLNPPP